ncbi:hypothetical protein V2I21_03245 [Campylobacter sp. CLAX-22107-21]|uniref:hypothetical protein n=1 Tax=Campylobacter devanensis TaxID=3161138 RepID=UPI002EA2D7B3|nr:hypothetical protein [Campylobacter sp. CLAX-22107-21]
MEKYIVMNRKDGTGSRLFSLVNSMWASKRIFGTIDNARFLWDESRIGIKKDFDPTVRDFGNNIIIAASWDKKESFFTKNFIQKHYIEAIKKQSSMPFAQQCSKSFEKLKSTFLGSSSQYLTVEIHYVTELFKDISSDEYRAEAAQCWAKIDFVENLKKMQQMAIEHASILNKKYGSFIALHLRSGGAIEMYEEHRLKNRQSTNHAIPYEYALGIINENKDQTILVIGDDVTSMRELSKIVNNKNVIFVENLRNIDKYTNLELFMYDVVIMSQAIKIYGSHSALTKLAFIINPKCEFTHLHQQINKQIRYGWLCDYYGKLSGLSPAQRAFSCFSLFLHGEACGEDPNILLKYLNEALKYDDENDKYRIHIINIWLKQGKIDEVDNFLKQILNTRFDNFINVFFSKYWSGKFAFSEVFENFTSHASEKYLHLSYLAARIYEVTGKLKDAIKFYKISQSLSFQEVNNNLQSIKDRYIEQLENEVLDLKNNLQLSKDKCVEQEEINNNLQLIKDRNIEQLENEVLDLKNNLQLSKDKCVEQEEVNNNLQLIKDRNIEQLENEVLDLKNNILDLKRKLQGSAKSRIKNYLSYKLGKAIVENSKSIWGYISMPYVLSYIAKEHIKELAKRKEKLPNIETLYDYKEAIKIKEQITYKIGEAFIRGIKTWYKGGLIRFIFEVQKIKKQHINKV